MTRSHWSAISRHAALFALSIGFATGCGRAKKAESVKTEGEAETPSAAVQSLGASEPGSGTLWVDDVQYDNFRGSCDISRRNGAEDIGELSNPDGLKMLVGIDNVDAKSGDDMSFMVTSDSTLKFRRSLTQEQRGTITRVALERQPTPKGKSSMLALVSFTGSTASGTSVKAHIVCELQNKYT